MEDGGPKIEDGIWNMTGCMSFTLCVLGRLMAECLTMPRAGMPPIPSMSHQWRKD